ncbi:MAG: Ig-like domain-containing protein [Halothece sp. Uz-M2-17]|nr:Ig-like domain-containing protein [Halothece sp. Uz-M2-17]
MSIIVLSFLLFGLISGETVCGDNCWLQAQARVENFSWQDEKISADHRAFIIRFSRPMDQESVENNIKLNPELPGKISWSGKRMAYTLEQPAPYGTEYELTINGATDRLGNEMQFFQETFQTRDRAFVYLGVKGEEKGRLILYNLTQQEKTMLTPANLVVNHFQSYPQRDRILFSAISQENWEAGKLEQKLYTVTTGINKNDTAAGKVELILNNETYQIFEFELSPDGQKIVIRRAKKDDLQEMSLWVIEGEAAPKRLENSKGGEFIIPPDSQSVAIAQGQGVALIPLAEDSNPANFLPQYGQVLTFSPDGRAAAMVNFNTQDPDKQYTRSLYLVTNRGVEKNLLDIEGSILSCEFSPAGTDLYCLLTEVIDDEQYREQPYLVSINLETTEVLPLLTLPKHQDIAMSLSPDGLALLFDQVMTINNYDPSHPTLRSDSGKAIIESRLWLLVPTPALIDNPTQQPELEELPISGLTPLWLP